MKTLEDWIISGKGMNEYLSAGPCLVDKDFMDDIAEPGQVRFILKRYQSFFFFGVWVVTYFVFLKTKWFGVYLGEYPWIRKFKKFKRDERSN